jgi:hypothetical protein
MLLLAITLAETRHILLLKIPLQKNQPVNIIWQIIGIFLENHTKQTNTFIRKNPELRNVKIQP